MRQAGVLAAAGLIALEKMTQRLDEDHANARLLAETLAGLPDVEIDPAAVQTNIVIFSLKTRKSAELVTSLKARDVLVSTVGPRSIRLVTHYDASRAACMRVAQLLTEELSERIQSIHTVA